MIFNPTEAKKVYKSNYKLQDQWEQITKGKNVKDYDRIYNFLSELNKEIEKSNPYYTASLAKSFTSNMNLKNITPYVNGLIFTGEHDGQVAIVYDRSSLKPMAFAECGDGCETPIFKPLEQIKHDLGGKHKHIEIKN